MNYGIRAENAQMQVLVVAGDEADARELYYGFGIYWPDHRMHNVLTMEDAASVLQDRVPQIMSNDVGCILMYVDHANVDVASRLLNVIANNPADTQIPVIGLFDRTFNIHQYAQLREAFSVTAATPLARCDAERVALCVLNLKIAAKRRTG